MTNAERNVIQWAFNLTDSIVAGDYHIPKPMTYALNMLQDATFELLNERKANLKNCTSSDFKKFQANCVVNRDIDC